jgi:hypothetical protein
MLRFARRPDHVFHAIVSEALDQAIDNTKVFRDGHVLSQQDKRELQESYEACFPRTATLLTSDEAVPELQRLRNAHLDTNTLSQLTDYHWLLLYESIVLFCDFHNESTNKKIGSYQIDRIDTDWMIDAYFWDLDFLTPEMTDLTESQRDMLAVSRETWAVVEGLKPHPDELRLVAWERPGPHSPNGTPPDRHLAVYPPTDLPEWYIAFEEQDTDWGFKD